METVLAMQDETLESWLGAENSKAPAKIVLQAHEALQWAAKHRISRCKEDFDKKNQDPKRREAEIEGSKNLRWNDLTWDGSSRYECPACLSSGFLGGTLWNEKVVATELAAGRETKGEVVLVSRLRAAQSARPNPHPGPFSHWEKGGRRAELRVRSLRPPEASLTDTGPILDPGLTH
jgi:hypothetical protein